MAETDTRRRRPERNRDDAPQVINVPAPTQEQTTNRAILEELARLGGNLANEDALEFSGNKVILPESMSGNIPSAIKWLRQHEEQQETIHRFERTFRYRPYDGANAFQQALKTIWGNTGIGATIYSMFGNTPPTFRTIDIGPDEQTQVPQAKVNFPPLEAEMYIGGQMDIEVGPLFHLVIDAPRKFRGHVEGLFLAIEDQLRRGSIYKGKAITGAEIPTYLDLSKVDPTKVVYSDEVMTQLDANVWSVIRHAETLRGLNIDLKRAALLYGPYGTGKTLAAYLTGQVAVQNGWTFVFCRPGVDDLAASMRTALLYAPAVVFFEDVDVVAESGEADEVSKLLDLFDGITAKNQDCLAILTTNHPERIQKALLRPGRLDAIIEIGQLDAPGIGRLLRAKVAPRLLADDLDMTRVCAAMDGFLPAFATEAIDRAVRYGVARANGVPKQLTTEDFVDAAAGLIPQLELMRGAGEAKRRTALDEAVIDLVRNGVDGAQVLQGGMAVFDIANDGRDHS